MTSIRKCKFTDNPSYILKNIREALGVKSRGAYEWNGYVAKLLTKGMKVESFIL